MLEQLSKLANESQVALIRGIYVGPDGISRGKAFRPQYLGEVLEGGIGLTAAQASVTPLDSLPSASQYQPVGEVRIRPDPETFHVLPYLSGHARMLSDLETLEGKPWELCPRSLLKSAVAELARRDLKIQAAFENEFTLYRPVASDRGTEYVPLDQLNCFSSAAMDIASPYILPMIEALEAQGIAVEKYFPEAGSGQQELPVHHQEGVKAADQQVVFKETIRGVALTKNVAVSFMPKPDPNSAGNGCHVHFSLWDKGASRNLFYDPSQEYSLSDVARHFMAGILTHTAAIMAFSAPTTNSYRRFVERCWSSTYVCWGPDNREATVRAASGYRGREAETVNLEFKPSDPTCNPYLTLSALIYAGLDGIDRKLEPPPATLTDPALYTSEQRAERKLQRYPTDLAGALEALEADAYLCRAMGAARVNDYLTMKRAELDAIKALGDGGEQRAYQFRF